MLVGTSSARSARPSKNCVRLRRGLDEVERVARRWRVQDDRVVVALPIQLVQLRDRRELLRPRDRARQLPVDPVPQDLVPRPPRPAASRPISSSNVRFGSSIIAHSSPLALDPPPRSRARSTSSRLVAQLVQAQRPRQPPRRVDRDQRDLLPPPRQLQADRRRRRRLARRPPPPRRCRSAAREELRGRQIHVAPTRTLDRRSSGLLEQLAQPVQRPPSDLLAPRPTAARTGAPRGPLASRSSWARSARTRSSSASASSHRPPDRRRRAPRRARPAGLARSRPANRRGRTRVDDHPLQLDPQLRLAAARGLEDLADGRLLRSYRRRPPPSSPGRPASRGSSPRAARSGPRRATLANVRGAPSRLIP